MTLRRLEILQWFGALGAFLTWIGWHVTGSGLTQARCNVAGTHWGIGKDVWELALLAAGVTVCLVAEAAAALVFRATRGSDFQDGPPVGRMHFFAAAALVANLLFLMMIVLGGVGSVAGIGCRQS
jgi:hypothetical protein